MQKDTLIFNALMTTGAALGYALLGMLIYTAVAWAMGALDYPNGIPLYFYGLGMENREPPSVAPWTAFALNGTSLGVTMAVFYGWMAIRETWLSNWPMFGRMLIAIVVGTVAFHLYPLTFPALVASLNGETLYTGAIIFSELNDIFWMLVFLNAPLLLLELLATLRPPPIQRCDLPAFCTKVALWTLAFVFIPLVGLEFYDPSAPELIPYATTTAAFMINPVILSFCLCLFVGLFGGN